MMVIMTSEFGPRHVGSISQSQFKRDVIDLYLADLKTAKLDFHSPHHPRTSVVVEHDELAQEPQSGHCLSLPAQHYSTRGFGTADSQ